MSENGKTTNLKDRYVLDSFALLGFLQNEASADRIEALLNQSQEDKATLYMSLINLGEVAYQIERRQGENKLPDMLSYLDVSPIQFMEASRQRILSAARLKAQHPISYADAFAAALCAELDATLLTGDPEFRALEQQIKIEWLQRR